MKFLRIESIPPIIIQFGMGTDGNAKRLCIKCDIRDKYIFSYNIYLYSYTLYTKQNSLSGQQQCDPSGIM